MEHRQRFEQRDIAIIAALTRADHSTIFFHGYTQSGYVRDGVIYTNAPGDDRSRQATRCEGRAISRDGMRIAYVPPADRTAGCRVTVRYPGTGVDKEIAEIPESWGVLAWSWDDRELVYQRAGGLFAVSTTTGNERRLCRLPPRISGTVPPGSWKITAVDWPHEGSDVVVSVTICAPTREPGTCSETGHVLRMSSEDSRVLAMGWGAAVSPAANRVGFMTDSTVEAIDFDGSNQSRIVTVPFATWFLPFLGRETTGWSRVIWSPRGDRLVFSTVLDEEFNGNAYVVDVRRQTRRALLRNTSIDILEWRR